MIESHSDRGTTRVLIDASPDPRQQMLRHSVRTLDAVLFTHEHADHTHGIDELRAFFLRSRRRVPVWADELTGQMLTNRFAYCFYTAPGSDYPAILDLQRIVAGRAVSIDGEGGTIEALPFKVLHGTIDALGFRIGNCAYTPDLNGLPVESIAALGNLDLWIVDALKRTPHPSHLSLPETLDWISRINPRRAIITNMHVDMDYASLERELPGNVRPAHDGLQVEI